MVDAQYGTCTCKFGLTPLFFELSQNTVPTTSAGRYVSPRSTSPQIVCVNWEPKGPAQRTPS